MAEFREVDYSSVEEPDEEELKIREVDLSGPQIHEVDLASGPTVPEIRDIDPTSPETSTSEQARANHVLDNLVQVVEGDEYSGDVNDSLELEDRGVASMGGWEYSPVGLVEIPIAIGTGLFSLGSAAYESTANTAIEAYGNEGEIDFARTWVDNHTKILAGEKGFSAAIAYEPQTFIGERGVELFDAAFQLALTPFHATADFWENSRNKITQELIAVRQEELGRALDPKEISEYLNAGGPPIIPAITKTLIERAPEIAMITLPFAKGMRIKKQQRAALKEVVENVEALRKATAGEVIKTKVLDTVITEELTPGKIGQLRTAARNGELSGDIVIETIEGTPTRVLSGADNYLYMKQVAAQKGVDLTQVRVRYLEKEKFDPEVNELLLKRGKQGMKNLILEEQKLAEMSARSNEPFLDKMNRRFVDRSGNIKRILQKELGPEGERAVMMFNLISGGTPRGQLRWAGIEKRAWGRLGPDDPAIRFTTKYDVPDIGKISESKIFDWYIDARRVQEIMRTTPLKSKRISEKKMESMSAGELEAIDGSFETKKLGGALKPSQVAGTMRAIRQTIGEKRFAQFESRHQEIVSEFKVSLQRAKEHKLINQKEFDNMINLEYFPRRFLKTIDPVAQQKVKVNGNSISVAESGIEALSGGQTTLAQLLNAREIMAESIVRLERRIAKNDANNALLDAVDASPGNAFFRETKIKNGKPVAPRNGWKQIAVRQGEKTRFIEMPERIAQEWTQGDPVVNAEVANTIRIWSGSALVRPFATGYNPEFAIKNFPRDMMHSWKATGGLYSTFYPRFRWQQYKDLFDVWEDAWTKTGRYTDYINEGGGLPFLSHQGRIRFNQEQAIGGTVTAKQALKEIGFDRRSDRVVGALDGLAKWNEFSEIWVRLGIREQGLKQGMTPTESTYLARNYLDFSQGGSVTKAIDLGIPYTNAATQALRTSLREYRHRTKVKVPFIDKPLEVPGLRAAAKDAQILMMKSFVQAGAWTMKGGAEVLREIDDGTLYENIIFPTGQHIYDDRGYKRNVVIKIAIDNSVVPITSIGDAMLKRYLTGEVPNEDMLGEWRAMLPFYKSLSTPTGSLVSALLDYDTWTGDKVWKGKENIKLGAEFTPGVTGELAQALGRLGADEGDFNDWMSPTRIETAGRSIFPGNPYLDSPEMLNNLYDIRQREKDILEKHGNSPGGRQAAKDAIDREFGNIYMRYLADTPMLRKFIHLTHPLTEITRHEKEVLKEVNTVLKIEDDLVNQITEDMQTFTPDDPKQKENFTKLTESLTNRFASEKLPLAIKTITTRIALDAVWSSAKLSDSGIPQRTWVHWNNMDTAVKADLFYWKWREKGPKGRAKMWESVAVIDRFSGRTFKTEGFDNFFNRNVAEFGSDVLPEMDEF